MATLDWKQIHHESIIVDLHVHPSFQQQIFSRTLSVRYVLKRTFRGSPFDVRANFPRLRMGGVDVILSILHVPERGLLNDFKLVNIVRILRPDLWHKFMAAPPYDATLDILGDMEKAVAESKPEAPAQMAHSVSDLDAILRQPTGERPIAVIHAVEGAHSLGLTDAPEEEILAHLDALYNRGVIYITLAHFYPNAVVNPCYPFPEDIVGLSDHPMMWRDLTLGLTPIGKKVVERMIEKGMLIDLSHSSPAARRDVYAIADASGKRVPLLATHVGAYGINPSPYNLEDWEIQRIARDGGVVGVIFMPYWLMPKESNQGINFISRHIRYLADVGGEDVVGIGTDFDGFTTPPDDLDNAGLMRRLTQRLVVDGYGESQIKKILGGNALRVICDGWGRK